jgi:GNAT superfamily N-acetyltransferase
MGSYYELRGAGGMASALKYAVRRGNRADARTVLKIFFAALDEHGFARTKTNVNPEVATFGLGDPRRDDFVVTYRGKVVGFVIVLPMAARTGELAKLFVTRSHRARGVGTILMDTAIEAAKRRGYVSVLLETRVEFASALEYYERHGWVCAASTPSSPLRTYQRDLIDTLDAREHASQLVAAKPLPLFLMSILTTLLRYRGKAKQLRGRLAKIRAGSVGSDVRT